MNDLITSLRERYRKFADVECHEYSTLYSSLAYSVAADDRLLAFIAGMPDPQPNLFFASVQYLTGARDMPGDGAELRSFVEQHRTEVGELMRARHTQTNEVGRCAALLPALPAGPLALIEVGASAGLCLLLDQFFYDYEDGQVGNAKATVRLRCARLGPVSIPVPSQLPQVVWRRGLDIDPIDVLDADDASWLLACVWADHGERQKRLEGALRLARLDPPRVDRGDLVDDLPILLAEAPEGATLVVFHSAVFPYVQPERWKAFEDVLEAHSRTRVVYWISNEGPGVIASLDARAPKRNELRFLVGRTRFVKGNRSEELLGLAHYHGHDLEWLVWSNKEPVTTLRAGT